MTKGKYNTGIEFLKNNDEVINKLIKKIGYVNFKPNSNHFEVLTSSILSQQLSVKAYNSIKKRVLNKIKKISPERILSINDKEILDCGVSSNKLSYIKEIAGSVLNKKIDFNRFSNLENHDIIDILIKQKGIGPWTSKMFLISSLGRLDVIPFEDVGLQNSIKKFYRLDKKPTEKKILQISNKWGQYSSISSIYLWRGLDNKVE